MQREARLGDGVAVTQRQQRGAIARARVASQAQRARLEASVLEPRGEIEGDLSVARRASADDHRVEIERKATSEANVPGEDLDVPENPSRIRRSEAADGPATQRQAVDAQRRTGVEAPAQDVGERERPVR